jgi:hypothetical protein
MMGLELVRLVSQWAGILAVLAMVGCFLSATMAAEMSRAMVGTADDAIQLVNRMARVGGTCVIVAGATSTLYWWQSGVASQEGAAAILAALALAATMFTVVVRRLSRLP